MTKLIAKIVEQAIGDKKPSGDLRERWAFLFGSNPSESIVHGVISLRVAHAPVHVSEIYLESALRELAGFDACEHDGGGDGTCFCSRALACLATSLCSCLAPRKSPK